MKNKEEKMPKFDSVSATMIYAEAGGMSKKDLGKLFVKTANRLKALLAEKKV